MTIENRAARVPALRASKTRMCVDPVPDLTALGYYLSALRAWIQPDALQVENWLTRNFVVAERDKGAIACGIPSSVVAVLRLSSFW
jgi:hypothetical protein